MEDMYTEIENAELITFSLPKNSSLISQSDSQTIEDFSWFVDCYTQVYADVIKTFQHQAYGYKLIYGIDNDIIISYIEPWSREAEHSRLINYFINNDENYLTLIPGTVEEIYRYLFYSKNKKREITKLLYGLENNNASPETINSIQNLFNEGNLGNSGKSVNTDYKLLSLSLIELSNRIDFSLQRLKNLLCDSRFIPLVDIYGSQVDSIFDQEIMESIYIELANIRKGEEKINANLADAKNLATIIQHSNYEDKRYRLNNICEPGYFIRLLTATNTLNKLNLDDKYSDYIGSQFKKPIRTITTRINHSSAIRSCYEAIFSTILLQKCNNNISKSLDLAYELFLRCQKIEMKIIGHDRENWKSTRRLIGENDTNRVTRFINEINPDFYLDPCFQTLKNILIQDSIEVSNKKTEEQEEIWWENTLDGGIYLNDEDIHAMSKNVITKFKISEDVDNKVISIKNFGFVDYELDIPEIEFSRWTLENHFSSPKTIVFNLDSYKQVYYASWFCSLKESQILRIINDFILDKNKTIFKDNIFGNIYLDFENGNKYEKYCKIPQKAISYNEYKKNIKLLKNSEFEDLIPSRIICDTNLFNISFDIQIIGNKANQEILYTFSDKNCLEQLIALFKRTSLWREKQWPYTDILFEHIYKMLRKYR